MARIIKGPNHPKTPEDPNEIADQALARSALAHVCTDFGLSGAPIIVRDEDGGIDYLATRLLSSSGRGRTETPEDNETPDEDDPTVLEGLRESQLDEAIALGRELAQLRAAKTALTKERDALEKACSARDERIAELREEVTSLQTTSAGLTQALALTARGVAMIPTSGEGAYLVDEAVAMGCLTKLRRAIAYVQGANLQSQSGLLEAALVDLTDLLAILPGGER